MAGFLSLSAVDPFRGQENSSSVVISLCWDKVSTPSKHTAPSNFVLQTRKSKDELPWKWKLPTHNHAHYDMCGLINLALSLQVQHLQKQTTSLLQTVVSLLV